MSRTDIVYILHLLMTDTHADTDVEKYYKLPELTNCNEKSALMKKGIQ